MEKRSLQSLPSFKIRVKNHLISLRENSTGNPSQIFPQTGRPANTTTATQGQNSRCADGQDTTANNSLDTENTNGQLFDNTDRQDRAANDINIQNETVDNSTETNSRNPVNIGHTPNSQLEEDRDE